MRYAFADCVLDTERCELARGSAVVQVRPKVLQVLLYLIEHRDRVVSKQELFDHVWQGRVVGDATLNSCLKEARRALGDSGAEQRLLKTLHGHGYRFVAPVREASDHPAGSDARRVPDGAAELELERQRDSLPDREHKQVSVLACNLADFDRLAADAEAADSLLRRFFAAADVLLGRYGGRMAERSADSFTALFGAPRAWEDHARRAVHAALELQSHAASLAAEELLESLALNCGLHTGSMVVGTTGGADGLLSAVGTTVGAARRLRDAAERRLLASAELVSLIESEIDAEPVTLGDGTLAYRIRRLSRMRAGVPRRSRTLAAFVGREDEIGVVARRLDLARRGEGQVVCISGEPGIGKSRLVSELQSSFEGCRHLQASCLAYRQTSPYFPLRQLLRGVCGLTEHDGPAETLVSVDRTAREAGIDDATTVTALQHLAGLEAALSDDAATPLLDHQAAMQAATGLLLGASGSAMVLVIEDLHWLDASSELWLDYFVTRVAAAPVLLLVTYRPGYSASWLTHSSVTQLAVPRLNDRQSVALINSLSALHPGDREAERRIVSRGQGNPFFLEELTYDLASHGAPDVAPTTVQAVLASRIDQLEPADKLLLQVAAVIGTPVPHELLRAVHERSDVETETAIQRLEAREFLFENQTSGDRRYSFKHALTEDVAYRSLLAGTRRDLHRTIAEVYENRFAPEAERHPELVARHFEQAGLAERAMDYWIRAGVRAVLQPANPEAVSHFERALAASDRLPGSPELERRQLDIYLRMGSPLMASKTFTSPSVERAYRKAMSLCHSVGTREQLFTVIWGLWLHYVHLGDMDEAQDLAAQVLELAEELGDDALHLQAHHAAWTTLIRHGDLEVCKKHALAGVALYDPKAHRAHRFLFGGHDPGVCAYGNAALASWLLGYPDQAWSFTERGAALAAELEHPYSRLLSCNDAMELAAFCGDPESTLRYAREGEVLCGELNVPNYLACSHIYIGWSLAELGERSGGLELLEEGIAEYAATGAERKQAEFLLLLAELLLDAGLHERALAAIERARVIIERTGEVRWVTEIRRLTAELELRDGRIDGDAAERQLREAMSLAASQGCKAFELRSATSLARVLKDKGAEAEAYAVLQPVYGWFTEGFDTRDLREAEKLLAALR